MAHKAQVEFCTYVKDINPKWFKDSKVLDVGSLDINGNNRYLFDDSVYTGIDIGEGNNVDEVSLGHEYDAPDDTYDVIISTECFEHDMYYEKTISNIIRMLKPGGMFLFSCAAPGRPIHGVSINGVVSSDSPFTSTINNEWSTYYKNLGISDIKELINLDEVFSDYEISESNDSHYDLYFWGIKK